MPSPPPYGESSTCWWRPNPKSRGFVKSMRTRPAAIALPSRLVRSTESNSSGNSVTTSKCIVRLHHDPSRPEVDLAYPLVDQRDHVAFGKLEHIVGAVPEQPLDHSQRTPVRREDGAADEI